MQANPYFLGIVPFPTQIPLTIIRTPFKTENKKPIRRGLSRCTWTTLPGLETPSMPNPRPKPTRILKTGPANDAVIAMVDRSLRATVMLAIKSCDEFPQAKNVRPIMVLGIRQIMPNIVKRLTILSATRSSHVAETTNPKRVSGTAAHGLGGASPRGAKRRTTKPINTGTANTANITAYGCSKMLISNWSKT